MYKRQAPEAERTAKERRAAEKNAAVGAQKLKEAEDSLGFLTMLVTNLSADLANLKLAQAASEKKSSEAAAAPAPASPLQSKGRMASSDLKEKETAKMTKLRKVMEERAKRIAVLNSLIATELAELEKSTPQPRTSTSSSSSSSGGKSGGSSSAAAAAGPGSGT